MATAIGIIGCGNISATYFKNVPLFKGLEVTACADLNHDAAQDAAQRYGVQAMAIDDLLAAENIETVVNLTIPAAHCDVSCKILEAGKHVYSEKPLALSMADGLAIQQVAVDRGLSVGCAPDTFMGGTHQLARATVDAGTIGKVTSGSCHVMSPGMEMWHPNPDFFFKFGGGPILDMGPYYITNLVNLLGPVQRVVAMSSESWPERTITSKPRHGQKVKVEVATNVLALLEFVTGAQVTFSASWDVWAHRHANMEIYGQAGSLYVPDPNFFSGELIKVDVEGEKAQIADDGHLLAVPNEEHDSKPLANYRAVGLADMIAAIKDNREQRCSLQRALHCLEVMTGILAAAAEGKFVDMQTTCNRAQLFGPEEARLLIK